MTNLSIIIPVYNSENYIEDCLTSITSNKILNEKIEIILIDDGSTDNSCKIIDNFIFDNDVNIKLVKNKTNRGTGYSRNRGIKLSSYDYIAFVDSDDMIVPEIYDECLEIISSVKNDVIFFDLYDYDNGKLKTNPYSTISMYGFSTYNLNVDKKEKPNIMLGWSSCRFIISKEFLLKEDLKFCNSSLCEDACFVADMYKKMNKISVVNKVGYIYRNTNGSITIFDDENINHIFNLFKMIMNDYYYDDILYYQLLYLCLPLIIQRKDLNITQIKKYYEPIIDNIPENVIDGLFSFYQLFYKKIMEEDQIYLDNLRKTFENKSNLLTIIIPTYNCEDYIEKCLMSIIKDNKLFGRSEIILIDDGSTDDTVKIIDKIIKKYSNCKLIVNDSNKGSGYCRNKGIELATTPYILFVDNDDKIISTNINKALDLIYDENTEIVFFDTLDLVNDNELKIPKYSYINMFNIEEEKRNITSKDYKNIMFGWSPWHYIVSKKFIIDNDIKFGKGSIGDDIYFTSKIYCKMNNISIINDVGYIHRIGSGISKNKHKKEYFKEYIKVFVDIIQNYNYNEMLYWEILYLDLIKGVKINNISVKEYKSIIEPVYSLIPKSIKNQMFYLYKKLYDIVEKEDEFGFLCFKEIFSSEGMIR